MTQRSFEAETLAEHCKSGVARVLRRYDWCLLAPEELSRRTLAIVQAGAISDPWVAAVHVYCQCLYSACCNEHDSDRQNRAFLELQQYLFEYSFRLAVDIPYEIRIDYVNEALFRIWQKRDSYRKPEAFLANAGMELRNVVRSWWMRRRYRQQNPPWQQPATVLDGQHEPDDPAAAELFEHVMQEEFARRVRTCFHEALQRSPRARQQLEAVWLKYIAGYDDETISRYLDKPVASIHVLRSRGLNRLRADPEWQFLAQELGI
ncbi:MAG: RNA polymerase sigma factor [Oscillochloris sp.]|nr:RNA polymerase sigma factor [Oscillochloris sp.]